MQMNHSVLFRFLCGFAFGLVITKLFLLQDCISVKSLTESFTSSYVDNNIAEGSQVNENNQLTTKWQSQQEEDEEETSDEEDDRECKVPKFDPWDESIKQFITHPEGVHCNHIQPYMTYVDRQGYLTINKTETYHFKRLNVSFHCKYRLFDRKYGYKENIWYSNIANLTSPVLLREDATEVTCEYDNNKTIFYYNVHAHPFIRDDLVFEKPTEEQLSVLVFVVDSTSYSALKRNLPLTYDYTKHTMGMKYFKGFHKIGTDSFPNQMAWFTGKRMYSEEDMSSERLGGSRYKERKLDTWPFIWKIFSAKSYATVFNEDWPTYGIFHYMSKGFTKKMFDYDYHWFWLRLEQVNGNRSSKNCFFNEPLPKISIDIARKHVITLKDSLQFIVNVVTETTQSSDNSVEKIDNYLLQFWKDVFEGDYLQNTFVIFASDHGLRQGNIRSTYVGAMEDRLPFYGIWFPRWFYEKYPHIEENIDGNLDVVSSMFDVHETLLDVAMANYNGKQRKRKSRGQSQLYPIRRDRTCREAGVAKRWCTCHKEKEVDPKNNVDASEASIFLVQYINRMLDDHKDKCQDITFSKYNFFRKVKFDEENDRNGTHFFLNIETNPYNATFEAFMTVKMLNESTSSWTIKSGLLERTSRYDIFSNCIDSSWLKQFCPCRVL